ncbi:hypothetical protein ACHAXS_003729 [Conticribra weissflogii]
MKLKPFLSLCSFLLDPINTATAFHTPHRCKLSIPRQNSRREQQSSTSLRAYVDVSEDAERDIGSMQEWAQAYGVQQIPGVQLTSDDGRDIYAMTVEDVPEGNVVMYVPANIYLSSWGSKAELGELTEAEDLIKRLNGEESLPLFYIFVKILLEYQNGEDSPFFPWLNSLPRIYNSGAAMTPACYDCLPPLAAALAMEERVKFINCNQALKTVPFISDEIKNNKDLTRWAFNVVSTRSFSVEGERVLVPMADMINHSTYTNVDISYDDEGNCMVYTTTDVPAGSPLLMSYGDPTNPSALFAKYGFVDESSPASFCKIMNIQKNSELEDIGMDYSRMVFWKDTGDVAQEVLDVLLYTELNGDRASQQQFYLACINGDEQTKAAYHAQYQGDVYATLKDHVDTFLEDLEDLMFKASMKNLDTHPRIPLIMAHNQFVKETFMRVKANIDPIAANSYPVLY